jgi:hypothetical protein
VSTLLIAVAKQRAYIDSWNRAILIDRLTDSADPIVLNDALQDIRRLLPVFDGIDEWPRIHS